MHSYLRLSGRVAPFSGLTAISIAAMFFHLFLYSNGGIKIVWLLGDSLQGWELLIGSVVLALLFQYGLPVLCASAFFFGVPAKRLWTARIGMAAAVFSLVFYGLFVRVIYKLITGHYQESLFMTVKA